MCNHYFVTAEMAEISEVFENMDSHIIFCDCDKQTYCLFDIYDSEGQSKKDIFIVCNTCHAKNPEQRFKG